VRKNMPMSLIGKIRKNFEKNRKLRVASAVPKQPAQNNAQTNRTTSTDQKIPKENYNG